MCTLSIFSFNDKIIITMNRDEYRNRPESNTINHTTKLETQLYYPVDKLSGGTWFGFNSHGFVMALLNRYQDQDTHKKAKISRGIIIPKLLELNRIKPMIQILTEIELNNFAAFDLIITNKQSTTLFNWDGKQLQINNCIDFPYFHSSSSVDSNNVLPYRKQLFSGISLSNNNNIAQQILTNLHLNQDSQDASRSIYMSRSETHTKSISQVTLNKQTLNYLYINEKQLSNLPAKSPIFIPNKLEITL